ncbi:MRK1 [Sanghuangporus weigelae]
MPLYVYVQLGKETYYVEIDSTLTQRDDWLRRSVCTFEMLAHTSVFLQRRTMTPMRADISRSLHTRQYDTALLPPYLTRPLYLIESQTMVQHMVADLFSRVLLQGPPTVDPDALQDAETIVASYEASFANHVLSNESSVTDATTPVFRACIKAIEAVGASFQLDREHTTADAGVRMDSIVHASRLDGASAGLACEDKIPAVYDNHCNDGQVIRMCGWLELEQPETGFRAILLKAVLHTTAAGGAVLADISMARVDEVPGSPTEPHILDVDISYLIGAGGFARVFRGEVFIDDEIANGPIAVKRFNEDCEEYLVTEAAAYRMLRSLYDIDIPRYYGHFSGENNGFEYSAILISYCGAALETFDSLTQEERSKTFAILQKIHRAGVKHNDFRPSNILRSEQGVVRLADFSNAHTDHHCGGTDACEESISAADKLGLLRLYR